MRKPGDEDVMLHEGVFSEQSRSSWQIWRFPDRAQLGWQELPFPLTAQHTPPPGQSSGPSQKREKPGQVTVLGKHDKENGAVVRQHVDTPSVQVSRPQAT